MFLINTILTCNFYMLLNLFYKQSPSVFFQFVLTPRFLSKPMPIYLNQSFLLVAFLPEMFNKYIVNDQIQAGMCAQ